MPGLILNVTNYCRFRRKGSHTVRKGIGVNLQDRRQETVKDHESDTLKQDSVEQLTIGMFDSFKKRKNQGKAAKSVSTTRSNGELSTTSCDLEESEIGENRSQDTCDRGQSKKGKTKQLSKKKVLDDDGGPMEISKKLKKKKSRGGIDDSSQGNSEDDQYVKHNKENQDKRKTLKRGQSNRSDRRELRKSTKKRSSQRKIEKSEESSQEDSEDEQCLTRKNDSDTRKALNRQKSNRSDSDKLRKSKNKLDSQSRFEKSEESSYDDSEIERFAARFLKEAGTPKVEQREKSNHSRSSVEDLKKKRRSIENWYEQEKRNSKSSQCVISKKGKKKKTVQSIPASITVISDQQVETSLGLARTMISDFEYKKSPLSTPGAVRLHNAKIEDITGLIEVLEEDQMAMNCRIREIQEEASRLRLEKDEAHRRIKSLEESKLQDEFRLQKLGPNVGTLQLGTTSSTAKQALETSEVSDSVATTSKDEDKVTLVIASLIEAKTELQSQLLAAEEDKSNLRSELEQTKKTLCDLESDTAEDRERLRRHHISNIKPEFQLRAVDEHDMLKRSNQDLEAHQTSERAESPRSAHYRKTEESNNEHTAGTPTSFFPATWGYLSSPTPHEDDDNSEGTFWELISIGGGSSRRDKVAIYF